MKKIVYILGIICAMTMQSCLDLEPKTQLADTNYWKSPEHFKLFATQFYLFREQPFVISRSAAEIDEAWDPKERVLVQGIIDAYFLEGDEIVLVDYKTDRVRRGEEQKLVDLYHTQLEDYAQALHRMTGRRVKEKYIYSFTLKKEILLG